MIDIMIFLAVILVAVAAGIYIPSAIGASLVNKKPQFMYDVALDMDMKTVARIAYQVSDGFNADCRRNERFERSQNSIHLVIVRRFVTHPYVGAIRVDIEAQNDNSSVLHVSCPMELIGYTFYKCYIDGFLMRVDVITGYTGSYSKEIKRLW